MAIQRFIWWLVQKFFRGLMRSVFRIKIIYEGEHPLPGSYLAFNHPGLIDGVLALLPASAPIRVLAKIELFEGPMGWLFRAGRAIETDWHSPDRSALKEMQSTIEENVSVAIFPEGTRCSGTYEWIRSGLPYSLLHVNRPIYPVAIFGSRKAGQNTSSIPRLFSKITLVVGAPLDYSEQVLTLQGEIRISQINLLAERLRQDLERFVFRAAAEYGFETLPRNSRE
jgi:1-acyl-sn-glycerol-3-phosphate acyltransferase